MKQESPFLRVVSRRWWGRPEETRRINPAHFPSSVLLAITGKYCRQWERDDTTSLLSRQGETQQRKMWGLEPRPRLSDFQSLQPPNTFSGIICFDIQYLCSSVLIFLQQNSFSSLCCSGVISLSDYAATTATFLSCLEHSWTSVTLLIADRHKWSVYSSGYMAIKGEASSFNIKRSNIVL